MLEKLVLARRVAQTDAQPGRLVAERRNIRASAALAGKQAVERIERRTLLASEAERSVAELVAETR